MAQAVDTGRVLFVTHPQVVMDPAIAVPEWSLSALGRERMARFAGSSWLERVTAIYSSMAPDSSMAAGAIALSGATAPSAGGSLPHENRQPYLAINYCIALFGVFPPMA